MKPWGSQSTSSGPFVLYLLWFTWEDTGDAIVIKPTCAMLRSEDLDTLIDKAPEKHGVRLVLDLSDVQYVSSGALGKLINYLRTRSFVPLRIHVTLNFLL